MKKKISKAKNSSSVSEERKMTKDDLYREKRKKETSFLYELSPSDSMDFYYEFNEKKVVEDFNDFLNFNFRRKDKVISLENIGPIKTIVNNIRTIYPNAKEYYRKFYLDIYLPLYKNFDNTLSVKLVESKFDESWEEMKKSGFVSNESDDKIESVKEKIKNKLSFFFFFGQNTLHRMEINHRLASSLVDYLKTTSFDKMKDYFEALSKKIDKVLDSVETDQHCKSIENHRGSSLGEYIEEYLTSTEDLLFPNKNEDLMEILKEKENRTKSNTRKRLIEDILKEKPGRFITCSEFFYCVGKNSTKEFLKKKGATPEMLNFFDSFVFKTLIPLFYKHNFDRFRTTRIVSWDQVVLDNNKYSVELSGLMRFDPTLMINEKVEIVESIMKSYYAFNPKFREAPSCFIGTEDDYYLPYHNCLGPDERSLVLRKSLKNPILYCLPENVDDRKLSKILKAKTIRHYDQSLAMCFYRIIKCGVDFSEEAFHDEKSSSF